MADATYTFRPVLHEESDSIRSWRNASEVRNAMLTQHCITKEEHQAWWASKLVDKSYRLMMLEQNGVPMSIQAYFDIHRGNNAWWAFYFTPNVPQNLAQKLKVWQFTELTGLMYAFSILQLKTIYCEVLQSNSAVTHWHKHYGFKECDASLSPNTAHYDLQVLQLKSHEFAMPPEDKQQLITIQHHPFDLKAEHEL